MTRVPNDVGDSHQSIIDGHTEIVHRHAVAPENNEIPKGVSIPRHLPTNCVWEFDSLILGIYKE